MLEKYELPIGLKNNSYEKQGGKNRLNEFNALFDIQLYKHVFSKNLTSIKFISLKTGIIIEVKIFIY